MHAGSGAAILSPSGDLLICPKQLLILRCQTTQRFQQWNITVSDFKFSELRQVTAYGIPDIAPLWTNYTIFNFTREAVSPLLETSVAIINATADLEVSCVAYTGSVVTSIDSSMRAAINIIKIHRKLDIMLILVVSLIQLSELMGC